MIGVSANVHFGLHAERQEADPERFGDGLAVGEMAPKLGCGVVRGLERRARQFELAAGFERNRRAAICVIEADQMAAVLDALPAELGVHPFEQGANPAFALIGHRREAGAVKRDLLVLRADTKRTGRLASCFEPGRKRVARLNDFPVDDVASHKGDDPSRPARRRMAAR